MASVNGLTVKALKTFRDHEGCEIAQGNLYLGSKKIGFWSQDYMCGPDTFDLEREYDDDKLYQCFEQRGKNIEVAMWELLELMETEKEFKKWKCDRMFKATDGYHSITLGLRNATTTKEDILGREDVQKCIEENFYKGKLDVEIYGRDSFNVGDKIALEEIRRAGV